MLNPNLIKPQPLPKSGANGNSVLFLLIGLILFSCTILLIINYFTIKTLSVSRALIYGEASYSKSEKDGLRHLHDYLETHNEKYYRLFDQEMILVNNDGEALNGMLKTGNREIFINHLLSARYDESDAADVYWLIKYFRKIDFIKNILTLWQSASQNLADVQQMAIKAHQEIHAGIYSVEKMNRDEEILDKSDDRLTRLEYTFSSILNQHSRMIRSCFQMGNFGLILLIISIICYFSVITIKRAYNDSFILKHQNLHLIATNEELDRFVYSASHDLRAPITSLKGLVSIILEETDITVIREIAQLMNQSLDLQDNFIKEIINYSRNKRSELNIEKVNITELITSTISQHRYMELGSQIEITAETSLGDIFTDPLRLMIILNNLVSNAIKFSDDKKLKQKIVIRASILNTSLLVEVEDNGVGIHPDFQEKIFDMFFVTLHNKRGSGLGLYIIRETILKMGGEITVDSELGKGSCFKVCIPHIIYESNLPKADSIKIVQV